MSAPARSPAQPAVPVPEAVQALRRTVHGLAEVGHREHATRAAVERVLAAAPDIRVRHVTGTTALLAEVGPPDAPAVVLRAELDALPVEERTGVPWAATGGTAHACGHDVHVAAVAAVLLAEAAAGARDGRSGRPARRLVGLFQHCEETVPSGARQLVESGALQDLGAVAVIGMHVHPDVAWGQVAVTPGPVNAGVDEVAIAVHGAAGHAAYPHRAADPVAALAQVLVAAPAALGRRTDPMRTALLSIGVLEAGRAANAIPDRAEAHGTIRTFSAADRDRACAVLREVTTGVAAGFGCTGEVRVEQGEPPLVNDPALAEATAAALPGVGLAAAAAMRSYGADDFAWLTGLAPSLMGFVGLAGAPGFPPHPLHHPAFLPPDAAIGAVAAAHLAAAEAALPLAVGPGT